MSLQRGFTLAAAETEITRRLLAGERVLLVGASKTNLPTQLAEHPQVQLWDSEGARQRIVPAHARVVLFTKWCGHNQHKWIREDASKDKARFIWPELLGTGEIRRLLQPLIVGVPVERVNGVVVRETTPEVFDYVLPAQELPPGTCVDCGNTPGNAWSGSVRDFVEKHWSVDVEHTFGWQVREAKRLHRLAAQHGLSTTSTYIEKIVSVLNVDRVRERDEQRLSEERAALAREALEHDKTAQQMRHAADVMLPPISQLVPVPVVIEAAAHVDATNESRVTAELGELLRMIDDAQAVLGLARETIERLAKENAEQRGVRDRIRAKMQAALDAV